MHSPSTPYQTGALSAAPRNLARHRSLWLEIALCNERMGKSWEALSAFSRQAGEPAGTRGLILALLSLAYLLPDETHQPLDTKPLVRLRNSYNTIKNESLNHGA